MLYLQVNVSCYKTACSACDRRDRIAEVPNNLSFRIIEVPNNLCHGKIQFQNMALVTVKKYCEIKGNIVQNVD